MNKTDFINIADANRNLFFRFALRLTKHREDAEDVVQEALIKLWRNKDNVESHKHFVGYMLRAIRSVFIDGRRSKYGKLQMADIGDEINNVSGGGEDVEERIDRIESAELINSIIDSMPERWRLVIQLRDIEGYSTKDAAEILKMDAGTLKVNLSRARKHVRKVLQKKYKITSYEC